MMNHQEIAYLKNRVAYVRDEQAYKKLFYHFYPVLFRFTKNILKDLQQSEEVVSDVILKIWTMESHLAYVENLDVYLLRAARNTCFNLLKQKKTLTHIPEDSYYQEAYAESETPELRLVYIETENVINQSVAALPLQCQLVYRLIREEGFSHKKVSEILEISQNTIETHMRVALKKIKKVLEAYLGTEK